MLWVGNGGPCDILGTVKIPAVPGAADLAKAVVKIIDAGKAKLMDTGKAKPMHCQRSLAMAGLPPVIARFTAIFTGLFCLKF